MNLKEYLEESGVMKQAFAKKAKVRPTTIWHALSGMDIRLSSLAGIIRASDDAITVQEMEEYRKKIKRKKSKAQFQATPKRTSKLKKLPDENRESSQKQT